MRLEKDAAFSSRITGGGYLVVELDMGDPREDRLLLEDELREAGRRVQVSAREGRRPTG